MSASLESLKSSLNDAIMRGDGEAAAKIAAQMAELTKKTNQPEAMYGNFPPKPDPMPTSPSTEKVKPLPALPKVTSPVPRAIGKKASIPPSRPTRDLNQSSSPPPRDPDPTDLPPALPPRDDPIEEEPKPMRVKSVAVKVSKPLLAKSTSATTKDKSDYSDEKNRIESFSSSADFQWPHVRPSPEECASAGFIFDPTIDKPDKCKCWMCDCKIASWTTAEDPRSEHRKWSPSCPIVKSWGDTLTRKPSALIKIAAPSLSTKTSRGMLDPDANDSKRREEEKKEEEEAKRLQDEAAFKLKEESEKKKKEDEEKKKKEEEEKKKKEEKEEKKKEEKVQLEKTKIQDEIPKKKKEDEIREKREEELKLKEEKRKKKEEEIQQKRDEREKKMKAAKEAKEAKAAEMREKKGKTMLPEPPTEAAPSKPSPKNPKAPTLKRGKIDTKSEIERLKQLGIEKQFQVDQKDTKVLLTSTQHLEKIRADISYAQTSISGLEKLIQFYTPDPEAQALAKLEMQQQQQKLEILQNEEALLVKHIGKSGENSGKSGKDSENSEKSPHDTSDSSYKSEKSTDSEYASENTAEDSSDISAAPAANPAVPEVIGTWIQYVTDDGNPYYWNYVTGESVWERPTA